MTGYHFECINSTTNAGGVGVYIKSNISYKKITNCQLNLSDCEDIWIDININNNKNIIIGVVYRHPNSNLHAFKTKFENTIEILNQNKTEYLICGDFNINLLKINMFVNDYLDSLTACGCNQYINKPTRFSPDNTSQSLLDHIYSNLNSNKITCKILPNDISDHLPILTSINFKPNKSDKQNTYMRDMSKFDSSKFLTDLKYQLDVLNTDNFCEIDKTVDKFLQIYNDVVNKHAPIRKISKRQQKFKRQPWITSDILKRIKIKNKLFKKFIKLKSPEATENYKKFRNKLNHDIDKSKKLYYTNLFQTGQSDSKTLWKNIDKIIKFKKPKNNYINRIEKDNQIITDPKLICENINDFFINVGTNLANLIPNSNNPSKPENLIKINKNSIFLRPIYNKEILDMIAKLDSNKSTPSLCPPVKIIKISAEIIAPTLTKLFNQCLTQGIFPTSFKYSEIIPIHKSGTKTDISNHRPIALLNPFSKLLEKCMYTRLNNFFIKQIIIQFTMWLPQQFINRKFRTTTI